MIQTLLLCFIHGFKGDEETFFEFPEYLRKQVSEAKPNLQVHTAVYPKYETRGDLAACVSTFRSWLQSRVTALETTAGTPSPIQHPSVGVILLAHSMGGFVAADTLFALLETRPISPDPDVHLMFPLVHGLLAFDTPYNGLSGSMFAYGAFSHYQNLSSVWSVLSSVSSLGTTAGAGRVLRAGSPAWRRWQAIAARSGSYGAIVAGGAAVYMNRTQIAEGIRSLNRESLREGWAKVNRENLREGLAYVSRDSIGDGFAWMGSHLKFVGALMKQAQLKTRLERLAGLKGVGVADLYTSLGENGYWSGGYFVPKRTFCAIPSGEKEGGEEGKGKGISGIFEECANPKAGNEIEAHCSMFRPDKNDGYEEMAGRARDLVCLWVSSDPRKVVDDYQPGREQRERSMSEAHLFDDDGKVLGDVVDRAVAGKETEEDEVQLQAILSSDEMPEKEDGGVDEEALKAAAAVPLPVDELEMSPGGTTWKSRIAKPFGAVSMPSFSRPSISMPSVPKASLPSMPSMPSIPTFRMPGRGGQAKSEAVTEREENASQVPLPEEISAEDAEEAENESMRRVDSVDSGVEVSVYEVSKDEQAGKTN